MLKVPAVPAFISLLHGIYQTTDKRKVKETEREEREEQKKKKKKKKKKERKKGARVSRSLETNIYFRFDSFNVFLVLFINRYIHTYSSVLNR